MTDLTAVNAWTARLWATTDEVELSRHQTPTNIGRIRAAALDPATEAVRPEYVPVPPDHVAQLAEMAEQLEAEDAPFLDLVTQSLDSTLGFARALSDRAADAITAFGVAEYGTPSPELVAHAEDVLATPAADDPTDGPTDERARAATIDATALADLVDRVLAWMGVRGWTAIVRERSIARMAVASSAREVRIRADSTFTAAQLPGLIVHEVGTHVLRADEGSRQPLHMLARGLPGYLETEEGLATHHEAQVDPRPKRLRTFALRVVAADAALRGGLADVMARLTDHVDPATAFPIAIRSKRGMADLTVPGSPLKDVVYLRGLRSVGDHLADHPHDHPLLMAGKLGLPHLDLARRLQADGLLTTAEPRVQELQDAVRASVPPWVG